MGIRQLAIAAPWLAIGSIFTIAAAPVSAAAGGGKSAEVEAVDQQFNRALERSDVAALRDLIAEGYVFTDPTGRVSNKRDVIEGFATGRIKIDSQTTHEVRIEMYGGTAVETGLLISVAVRDGHNTSGTFRFTRVWVKRFGRWRTVAFQETAPSQTPAAGK